MEIVNAMPNRNGPEDPAQALRRRELEEFMASGAEIAELPAHSPGALPGTEKSRYERARRQLRIDRDVLRFHQRKGRLYVTRHEHREEPGAVHEVSVLPKNYEAVLDGRKNFELRKDAGYDVGDAVILAEWDGKKTGRTLEKRIKYVLRGGTDGGLAEGWCILSF